MRRAARILAWILAALTVAVGALWVALFLAPEPTSPPEGPLPASAAVARADKGPYARQTGEHCGEYSLAEVLRLAGETGISGEALVGVIGHDVSWSEKLSGTMPWRILAGARSHGISGRSCTARSVAEARRLDCLRAEIARGRPVIVLLDFGEGQHYVVVEGYQGDEVDLYDPAWKASSERPSETIDSNGARPGNRTLAGADFLRMWAQGGIAGVYGWWYAPMGGGETP